MWYISNIKLCRFYGETNRMVGRQRFKHLFSMGSSSSISEFILQRTTNQGLKQIRAFLIAYLQELKWSNIPNVLIKRTDGPNASGSGTVGSVSRLRCQGMLLQAHCERTACWSPARWSCTGTKGQMHEAHGPAPLMAMGPGGRQEREVIVRTVNFQFGKMGTC